jgi:hypothetical protein
MNGYPNCDDMGLAKEHKLQQEIDDENAKSSKLKLTTSNYFLDESIVNSLCFVGSKQPLAAASKPQDEHG